MAFSCKCLVSMRVAGTTNEESCICRRNFGSQISRGMTLIISRVGDDVCWSNLKVGVVPTLEPAMLSHSSSLAEALEQPVCGLLEGPLRDQWELHHTVKVTDTPGTYSFGHVVGLGGSRHWCSLGLSLM